MRTGFVLLNVFLITSLLLAVEPVSTLSTSTPSLSTRSHQPIKTLEDSFKQGGISIETSRWLPKANIESARYWSTQDWAKIVVYMDRAVPYIYGPHPIAIENGHTYPFSIDFMDSISSITIQPLLHESNGLISQASLSQRNARISRLDVHLAASASLKIVSYEVSGKNVITLDLTQESEDNHSSPLSLSKQKTESSSQIFRVVIDPGHGGRDPGSLGFGIEEKDIVLKIAQKVQALFVARTSIRALLTRTSDQTLSLEERGVIARRFGGDLFVSLHLNAHSNPQVHGIESYFLQMTSDAKSLQLATRENEMSSGALANFTAILRDLLSMTHASDSNRLAYSIHTQLLQSIGSQVHILPKDLGVKEAPFLVLLQAQMPAALIEISFITNPEENRRIQEDRYHQAVAEGIFNGIQKYLLEKK